MYDIQGRWGVKYLFFDIQQTVNVSTANWKCQWPFTVFDLLHGVGISYSIKLGFF